MVAHNSVVALEAAAAVGGNAVVATAAVGGNAVVVMVDVGVAVLVVTMMSVLGPHIWTHCVIGLVQICLSYLSPSI